MLSVPMPRTDPELERRLREAVEAYNAMSPVDRALHDIDQRRSFVRGQMWDTPADRINAILDEKTEFVLAAEVRRLRKLLKEVG